MLIPIEQEFECLAIAARVEIGAYVFVHYGTAKV